MRVRTVAPLLFLIGSQVAQSDKTTVVVIPWGVECSPIVTATGATSLCIGYEPLPDSIFGGRADTPIELEPLSQNSKESSSGNTATSTNKETQGNNSSASAFLDDMRLRREAIVGERLTNAMPQPGISVSPYRVYFEGLLNHSNVQVYKEPLDPLASSDCGDGKTPCITCDRVHQLGIGLTSFDPRQIIASEVGRTSLQSMLLQSSAKGEWPTDSTDATYYTSAALLAVQALEVAGVHRQREISQRTNDELLACAGDSIEKDLAQIETDIVKQYSAPISRSIPSSQLIDLNVSQRVDQAYQAIDSRNVGTLRSVGLLTGHGETIPLVGDKFDFVAARVNGSTATNPQAQRAKGLIGAAIALGRALKQSGPTGQSYAYLGIAMSVADIALGAVPVAGIGKDVYEAVLGVSILDGAPLSLTDRGLAIFGVMSGGIGDDVVRALRNLIKWSSGASMSTMIFQHSANIAAITGSRHAAAQMRGPTIGSLPTRDNLRNYLAKMEYSSLVDDLGRLRPEIVERLEVIGQVKSENWRAILTRDGSRIEDWSYYKFTVENVAGRFEGRVYRNAATGKYHMVKTDITKLHEWGDSVPVK